MATKGHLLYYPEGKHDILLGKELNDVLKSKVNSVTKVTYLDLKDLRDNSKLIPGSLYRITDYQCTTTQENTRSAGHQFDIVLLALSENKLAEEGWAMMHDNIYDVTFATGETIKCYISEIYYINNNPDPKINLVRCDTYKGVRIAPTDITAIDNVLKTATVTLPLFLVKTDDLTYNYFQNSNLSAWKVWYCLDNDTSRFAWADDSVDEKLGTITCSGTFSAMYSSNIICTRRSNSDFEQDGIHYYCYFGVRPGPQVLIYTTTENITYNTIIYEASRDGQGGGYTIKTIEDAVINSFTPTIITISGRGVIYRLIDEWNNDVGYDFKNIQFKRKLTNGQYDATNGTDTWCYTLNVWYNDMCQDASIVGNTLTSDEGIILGVCNNLIEVIEGFLSDAPQKARQALSSNCILSGLDEDHHYYGIYNCSIDSSSVNNTISIKYDGVENICLKWSSRNIIKGNNATFMDCDHFTYNDDRGGIYIQRKRVLTES